MLLNLIKRLTELRTTSPADANSILFLKSYLEDIGFYVKIIKSAEVSNLFNLLATTKQNRNIDICFAGHIDTVPPGDLTKWDHDPFTATIIDNKIYGRGIVDMKGAIACFIAAVKEYSSYHSSHMPEDLNIGVIITIDEELESQNGMIPVLEFLKSENYKIKNCIVGEPTCVDHIGDTIKIGRRGSINFKVELHGKARHVAYPENVQNTVKSMILSLHRLINYKFDDGNEYFPPTHCEITNININNELSNVTPEKIETFFNIRFNNLHNVDSLKQKIEEIFNVGLGCHYKVTHKQNPALPFLANDTNFAKKFSSSVLKITGRNPKLSTDGGTSDGRFLKDITNVIEFGLINKTAHQINENCSIDDLITLKDVYYNFLSNFSSHFSSNSSSDFSSDSSHET